MLHASILTAWAILTFRRENLFYSIAGIINSNLWGMPMVGADICGFIDATQNGDPWSNSEQLSDEEYEQLCSRCVTQRGMVACRP